MSPRPAAAARRGLVAVATAVLAASVASAARADDATPPGHVAIRAITGGGPDFVGLDVDLTTLRPVELEGGAALGLVVSSVYARVGYDVVTLATTDAGDRSGVFHLVILGGARGASFDANGAPAVGIDALAGFDYALWLSDHFAVDTEVVAGVTSWLTAPPGFGPLWANVSVLLGIGF